MLVWLQAARASTPSHMIIGFMLPNSGVSASHYYLGFSFDPFPIEWGTQQGSSLLPILFILALGPLAVALRVHSDVCCLEVAKEHHKLMLFTVILLFLSPPLMLLCLTYSWSFQISEPSCIYGSMNLHLKPLTSLCLQNNYLEFRKIITFCGPPPQNPADSVFI